MPMESPSLTYDFLRWLKRLGEPLIWSTGLLSAFGVLWAWVPTSWLAASVAGMGLSGLVLLYTVVARGRGKKRPPRFDLAVRVRAGVVFLAFAVSTAWLWLRPVDPPLLRLTFRPTECRLQNLDTRSLESVDLAVRHAGMDLSHGVFEGPVFPQLNRFSVSLGAEVVGSYAPGFGDQNYCSRLCRVPPIATRGQTNPCLVVLECVAFVVVQQTRFRVSQYAVQLPERACAFEPLSRYFLRLHTDGQPATETWTDERVRAAMALVLATEHTSDRAMDEARRIEQNESVRRVGRL